MVQYLARRPLSLSPHSADGEPLVLESTQRRTPRALWNLERRAAPQRDQSSLALWTFTSRGFLTPGREICCRFDGCLVSLKGGIGTARPVRADLYSASMIRTSCMPSSPDGSGSRPVRMHSEKCNSSGAN